MSGARRRAFVVCLFVVAFPVAVHASSGVRFEAPVRLDSGGRSSIEAAQYAPQLAETDAGPFVVWEDDRNNDLEFFSSTHADGAWAEARTDLPRIVTTFAADGAGRTWAFSDSPNGVASRFTEDGTSWRAGPSVLGAAPGHQLLSASGRDGRIAVARAAFDVSRCWETEHSQRLPSGNDATDRPSEGLAVAFIEEGRSARNVTLAADGRFSDVHIDFAADGGTWVVATRLGEQTRVFEISPQGTVARFDPPPTDGDDRFATVRIGATTREVVLAWSGFKQEIGARAYDRVLRRWSEPEVVGEGSLLGASAVVEERFIIAWSGPNGTIAERADGGWAEPKLLARGVGAVDLDRTADGLAFAYETEYPDFDVLVRLGDSDSWGPASRAHSAATLPPNRTVQRVLQADDGSFVTWDDDFRLDSGRPMIAERSNDGWRAAKPLPAAAVAAAPDGSIAVRERGDDYSFLDPSGEPFARVEDVSPDVSVIGVGPQHFALSHARIERDKPQYIEVNDVRDSGVTTHELVLPERTGTGLYVVGDGTSLVSHEHAGGDKFDVKAREVRADGVGAPSVLATGVPSYSEVRTDRDGRLVVAWEDDGRILYRVQGGPTHTAADVGRSTQFLIDAAPQRQIVVVHPRPADDDAGPKLRLARGNRDDFETLPPLPGPLADVGLGFGSVIVDGGPRCFESDKPFPGGGETGWAVQVRINDAGAVTLAARSRADVLVAQLPPGAREWSWSRVGSTSRDEHGEFAVSLDGSVTVAWTEHDDPEIKVMAAKSAPPPSGAEAQSAREKQGRDLTAGDGSRRSDGRADVFAPTASTRSTTRTSRSGLEIAAVAVVMLSFAVAMLDRRRRTTPG